MLEATFIHCPGVGSKLEHRLWNAGVRNWRDFLDDPCRLPIAPARRDAIRQHVETSLERLEARDYAWFARQLPQREHWRAYPYFKDRALYLDIETTGEPGYDTLTIVGAYNGVTVRQYIRGFDLEDFPEIFAEAALLVTFFGSGFDLPFIRRAYGIVLPHLHIDLCPLLKRLGFRGGLKKVEAAVGIRRPEDVRGLVSYDAVLLWRAWQRGDRKALERLLAYNAQDVLNLEALMDFAYPRMVQRTLSGTR
ncbi:MAG: ribonuclease H-like domain-containing protein [Chthonomonadales bacterium]